MSKNYKDIIQNLIDEKFKNSPEDLKKAIKEIEEEKKAPNASKEPMTPLNPPIDPQLTQELIEELNKWAGLNIQVVKDLIKRGADIKAKNGDGVTILHHASWLGDIEITKECLESGISANIQDVSGESPLHWAVDGNKIDTAKILIEQGANVNAKRNDNRTVLFYAKTEEMKSLLTEHGAE